MSTESDSEITILLDRWSDGDDGALNELLPKLYSELHRTAGAVVEQLTGADGDDRAAGGLVLGAVGQHDAAGGDFFGFQWFDHHAVVKRSDV